MMLSGKDRSKLCAFVNSYMRSVLGRGPREVKVVSQGDSIEVITTGVLTQIEKTYYRLYRDATLIQKLRSEIFKASFAEFQEMFARELGLELLELSSETNCETDSRSFFFKVRGLDEQSAE